MNSGTNGQHLCHEQHALCPARGCLDHAFGGGSFQSDRLLDENMLARLQGRDGHGFVLIRRRTEVDEINRGIGEEVFVARMAVQMGQVHVRAGRPEVAFDAGPVAGKTGGIRVCRAVTLTAAQTLGSEIVHHAHETETDDADPYHCRILMKIIALCIYVDSTGPMNSGHFR